MADKLPPLEFDELPELDFSPEQPTKPLMERQNAIGATFNVPGAAIRSAIQGKGYVEGAMNPSDVKKFQDIFIDKAQFTTSPVINAVLGMPASAAGLALDVTTNPAEMLTVLAPMSSPVKYVGKAVSATKIGQKAGQIAGKVLNTDITPLKWIKQAWGNKKEVEAIARESKALISKNTTTAINSLRKSGAQKAKIGSVLDKKYKNLLSEEERSLKIALDKAQQKYIGKVSSESLKVSSEIRKDLPVLYKQKSEEYGKGLNEILSKTNIPATKAEVLPVLEESLMNHGILNVDDAGQVIVQRTGATRAESQILKEYTQLRDASDDTVINVSELIQKQSLIKPKYGKVWNSSDHLQSEVVEGISGIISEKSPEIAAYRKAYAPFLEWKREANKVFRPFSGKYDNKSGTKILSKYADVNKALTRDETLLMSELKKYTKKEYVNNLKSIRSIGKDISRREQNIKEFSKVRGEEIDTLSAQRKAMIDNEIQSQIDVLQAYKDLSMSDVDAATRNALQAIQDRRIIVGTIAASTAGLAFLKYIKNRISYQVFGLTE